VTKKNAYNIEQKKMKGARKTVGSFVEEEKKKSNKEEEKGRERGGERKKSQIERKCKRSASAGNRPSYTPSETEGMVGLVCMSARVFFIVVVLLRWQCTMSVSVSVPVSECVCVFVSLSLSFCCHH
jgi:hypothetical protein